MTERVPKISIPTSGSFEAFAVIVDINGFTPMVSKAGDDSMVAHYVRDILLQAKEVIESHSGTVTAFMGDALLAVLPTADSTYQACAGIAIKVDKLCEYISLDSGESADEESVYWYYNPQGPSLKIAVEHGWIHTSEIYSDFLGNQILLIGTAINYAARISGAGKGNRCHVGPQAAERGLAAYGLEPATPALGKEGEGEYPFFRMDLGELWREGPLKSGDDSYWG